MPRVVWQDWIVVHEGQQAQHVRIVIADHRHCVEIESRDAMGAPTWMSVDHDAKRIADHRDADVQCACLTPRRC